VYKIHLYDELAGAQRIVSFDSIEFIQFIATCRELVQRMTVGVPDVV